MNKIVEIDGNKTYEIKRIGNGEIIVVIELGIGTHFDDWSIITKELSKKMTVFTYHRSGYGKSSLEQGKRTTGQIAKELNKLLEKEGINKNIILVGHSFGGLCVQHFAQLYPEKIIGMLLIDPNTIKQNEMEELPLVKERFSKDKMIEIWNRLSHKTKEEIEQEVNPKIMDEQMKLSKTAKDNILEFLLQPKMYRTMALEYEGFDESISEIKSFDNILEIPLRIMVRDREVMISNLIKIGVEREKAIIMEDTWQRIVKEVVDLSTNGKVIEVKNTTHCIYRFNPELIINEVENLAGSKNICN
ncbi:alpha/beta hydrolase [Clostridium senegalense]|uniref:alpha/beta fold hydrolase n=1 Tax=Clostridium senegalense TaxID=1465809 RepID=UPI001C10AE1A|nr:alpha/beta hydrolase [Clostridium senegalense]MBU5227625.1 alpha/beta hydrolase [Clostridium senegalense]